MPIIDSFHLNRSSPFSLIEPEENKTDLTLTQLAAPTVGVHGRVTNSATGLPVANATVKLISSSGDPVAHTQTNPAGIYSIEGLAPGTYTVIAALNGFTTTNGQTLVLSGGQIANIDISITPETPLNTVYGVITNQVTGTPVGNANVALVPALGTTSNVTLVKSNSNGQYVMCEIVDGSQILITSAAGFYESSFVPITIGGGTILRADVALVPFSVPQSTVNGFITQQDGTPIANACVGLYLLDIGGVEILQQVTFSDSSGFYIFGRTAAGNYIIKSKQQQTV